jgi:hypothetical protein
MLRKVQHALFLLSVLLLPLAEWRTFGAPINHRPLTIDLNGFMSASIFDLTFFIFSLAMLPTVAQALRGGRLFSWYLTYWVFGFGLIAITYVALEPSLPFLTPSQVNVIDVRSLIIHFAVAVVVTVYVANVEIWHIVRFSYWFYLAATAVFAILSAVAFSESIYFFVRYPFAVPTQISFPFPGQNVAAPFATICLLGLLGTAIVMRHGVALVVGIPLLILAAALTGSRSNMLVMVVAAAVFCVVYVLYGRREAQITTASTPFLWRKNLIYIVAGAVGAAAVLASNIDWQPIRRALSIFSNISSDVLLGGMAGSSRRDIWSNALKTGSAAGAGVDVSSAVESRRFGIGLVTLSGGCKTEGPLIHSLVPDTPYFVRLTMRRDARPSATLEVFSDPQHKQLLGRQSAPLSAVLPHLYLFLSNSGKHYKNLEGELNDFSIAATDAISDETQIETGSANLYENLFNGGAIPALDLTSSRIGIRAKAKRLRGYVNLPNAVPEAATRAVLTYQVRLSTVSFTMPIDPPVLFYVGFHDTVGEGAAWNSIRNGLLIQFVRDNSGSPSENAYHAQDDRYRFLARHVDGKHANLTHAEFSQKINDEISCGDGQRQDIADLWKRPIQSSDIAKTKEEGFGARIIADKPVTSQISVSSADSTSDAIHRLNERGSTHNVYLDWHYYVGPSSLATFVLFVSSLLAAFAAFTWKHRCSVYFTFYLAVMLQLITIFGLMYAQPYIWIKYFWFVMGIASGLMVARVNDDLDDRPFR